MPILPEDFQFMHHALAMAEMAVGITAPNPSVGCVIVKDGKVLSASHTAKGGRPHAETIALEMAGGFVRGATAYVTLEPCSHYGQTPPCAAAFINAGIKRVIIATPDPFVQVNGKGIKMLEDAGVDVVTGVCEAKARRINEGFFSVQTHGRPFITLKTATSLDGKIALKNGKSKWLTGEESRNYVHLMRAKHDAIITGIGTIMADDPLLTCRLPGLENFSPARVILDTNLNLPTTSQIVRTARNVPCLVATLAETIINQSLKAMELEALGVHLLTVKRAKNGKVCIEDTLRQLANNSFNSAMIEAGRTLNTEAMHLNLVDRIAWFKAPFIIGSEGMPSIGEMNLQNIDYAANFKIASTKQIGRDTLQILDKI